MKKIFLINRFPQRHHIRKFPSAPDTSLTDLSPGGVVKHGHSKKSGSNVDSDDPNSSDAFVNDAVPNDAIPNDSIPNDPSNNVNSNSNNNINENNPVNLGEELDINKDIPGGEGVASNSKSSQPAANAVENEMIIAEEDFEEIDEDNAAEPEELLNFVWGEQLLKRKPPTQINRLHTTPKNRHIFQYLNQTVLGKTWSKTTPQSAKTKISQSQNIQVISPEPKMQKITTKVPVNPLNHAKPYHMPSQMYSKSSGKQSNPFNSNLQHLKQQRSPPVQNVTLSTVEALTVLMNFTPLAQPTMYIYSERSGTSTKSFVFVFVIIGLMLSISALVATVAYMIKRETHGNGSNFSKRFSKKSNSTSLICNQKNNKLGEGTSQCAGDSITGFSSSAITSLNEASASSSVSALWKKKRDEEKRESLVSKNKPKVPNLSLNYSGLRSLEDLNQIRSDLISFDSQAPNNSLKSIGPEVYYTSKKSIVKAATPQPPTHAYSSPSLNRRPMVKSRSKAISIESSDISCWNEASQLEESKRRATTTSSFGKWHHSYGKYPYKYSYLSSLPVKNTKNGDSSFRYNVESGKSIDYTPTAKYGDMIETYAMSPFHYPLATVTSGASIGKLVQDYRIAKSLSQQNNSCEEDNSEDSDNSDVSNNEMFDTKNGKNGAKVFHTNVMPKLKTKSVLTHSNASSLVPFKLKHHENCSSLAANLSKIKQDSKYRLDPNENENNFWTKSMKTNPRKILSQYSSLPQDYSQYNYRSVYDENNQDDNYCIANFHMHENNLLGNGNVLDFNTLTHKIPQRHMLKSDKFQKYNHKLDRGKEMQAVLEAKKMAKQHIQQNYDDSLTYKSFNTLGHHPEKPLEMAPYKKTLPNLTETQTLNISYTKETLFKKNSPKEHSKIGCQNKVYGKKPLVNETDMDSKDTAYINQQANIKTALEMHNNQLMNEPEKYDYL